MSMLVKNWLILISVSITILGFLYLILAYNNYEFVKTNSTFDLKNYGNLTGENTSLFKKSVHLPSCSEKDGINYCSTILFSLNPEISSLYEKIGVLQEEQNAAFIYPLLTSAAYEEPGFYNYYLNECNIECLTVELKNQYALKRTSSGNAVQILALLGYDLISDLDIDKDPKILLNYEKIIVLHNEYVTQNEFDAITNHPKVIYLYPNALYAKVIVDYTNNTSTLIRGHGYPESSISNGFDWELDNSKFEYDNCAQALFEEVPNGIMLNCYPEDIIDKSPELLRLIKEY